MNTRDYPISKSFLSDEALAQQISVEYALPDSRCQLISATMRDVYLVRSKQKRHVLFVYRHNQRTADEIRGEWQFVADLHANGVKVVPAMNVPHWGSAYLHATLHAYLDSQLERLKHAMKKVILSKKD